MMRTQWPPRSPAKLRHLSHDQLGLYALAASAAGVGVLALAQPSEAKIVYHAAHQSIGKNAHYKLDLNHDGVTDFIFANTYSCNQDYCVDVLNANAVAGNGVVGKRGFLSIPYAFVLRRGSEVGPKQPFSGQLMASYNVGTLGRWINVNGGYLGVRFSINGKLHYGWARLNVHFTNGVFEALLTGYAYETIPNKPIKVGQTKGPEENGVEEVSPATSKKSTVQPASLGLLAMGSPALAIWRREDFTQEGLPPVEA